MQPPVHEENIMLNCTSTRSRLGHSLATALTALMLVAITPLARAGTAGVLVGRASSAEQQRALSPVLPAQAKPFGYSLEDMARLVAPFNVTDRSGPPPNSPFQILYQGSSGPATFEVGPGKILYVPLVYNDDSPPVIGHFPAPAQNRQQALHYWFSQNEFGVTAQELIVDGKTVTLSAAYVSGLSFDTALPDTATQYMTTGAFISPLSRGAHTIEIHFKATGDALRVPPFDQYFPDGFVEFSILYNVKVR
jgi:hypothetical protein